MTLLNKVLILLTSYLCVALVGCSTSHAQVERTRPVEVAYGTETLDIRNCDSNEDMITTLASHAPVRQHISISEEATVVETASAIDIPAKILDDLRSQVEREFQPIFEEAVANAEGVEFTIPGHKIHMYQIHWIQQTYRATISFSMDDQTCSASYVYTLETPVLDSFTVMACTA